MAADAAAFAALRERLDRSHREATAAAFALGDEALVRTGLAELDAAVGGGFPRGNPPPSTASRWSIPVRTRASSPSAKAAAVASR